MKTLKPVLWMAKDGMIEQDLTNDKATRHQSCISKHMLREIKALISNISTVVDKKHSKSVLGLQIEAILLHFVINFEDKLSPVFLFLVILMRIGVHQMKQEE